MKIDATWLLRKIATMRVKYRPPANSTPDERETTQYWLGYNTALTHVDKSVARRMNWETRRAKK